MVMSFTGIFVLTLSVSLWVAYDLDVALIRFSTIAIGLLLMVSIGRLGYRYGGSILGLVSTLCGLCSACIGMAYGLYLIDNSGAVASALMILLPFAALGVWWQWRSRHRFLLAVAVVALVTACIWFMLTQERTAWISLLVGLLGAGYFYWRFDTNVSSPGLVRRISDIVLGLAILIGMGIYAATLLSAFQGGWLDNPVLTGDPAIGSELRQRIGLWRESLALAREYYYTGSGLAMTPMIYSTYVLSMHSPYWYHAHNIYLQVALEQGMLGATAFVGMTLLNLGATISNGAPF